MLAPLYPLDKAKSSGTVHQKTEGRNGRAQQDSIGVSVEWKTGSAQEEGNWHTQRSQTLSSSGGT